MPKNINETFYNKYGSIIEGTRNHYEVPAQKIVFSPESLFTQKFLDDLNSILNMGNSGKKFRKMKYLEKRKVVNQLGELLQTETRWRDLVRTSKFDTTKIKEIFPEKTEHFQKLYFKTFFPQLEDTTSRQRNMRGSEKVKKFIEKAFIFIKENHPVILTEGGREFKYTDELLTDLVRELPVVLLFQDIIKICMKKAYDTNVNIESNNPNTFRNTPLNTSFLRAKQTDLLYPMLYYFDVFMTSFLLNDLARRKLLVDTKVEYVIETLKLLEQRYKDILKTDYTKHSWSVNTSEIAHIFLGILEGTPVIKESFIDNSRRRKSHKIYVFDHKLDNSIAFSKHLPRIIPPKKGETSSCVESWIAPVKRGTFNVQVSENALTALNNAQRKEFVINTRFLELLKEVDAERDKVSEFPTRYDYLKTQTAYAEWSNSAWNNLLDLLLYRTTKNTLRVNKRKTENLHFKTITLCGISNLECYANVAKNQSRIDVLRNKQMRQLLQTSVKIGERFKDYPLYYSTLLDFRLRMYPLQYLMSRTSGYLKNLLQESKDGKLKIKGVVNMLEAYYSPDPTLLQRFRRENLKKKKICFASLQRIK